MNIKLDPKRAIIYLVLAIVVLETIAHIYLKKSKLAGKKGYIIISVILYSIISFLLIQSYDYDRIGIVNFLWSILSIIIVFLAGFIFYHEKITFNDVMGILFVAVGVYFVFISEKHSKNSVKQEQRLI